MVQEEIPDATIQPKKTMDEQIRDLLQAMTQAAHHEKKIIKDPVPWRNPTLSVMRRETRKARTTAKSERKTGRNWKTRTRNNIEKRRSYRAEIKKAKKENGKNLIIENADDP